MAIQITDKLTDEIKKHIDEMCNSAIIAEFGSPNKEIPFHINGKDATLMDTMVWGKHLHLRSQIPSKWCEALRSDGGSLNLRFRFNEKEIPDDDSIRLCLHTDGRPYYAPPQTHMYSFWFHLDSNTATGVLKPLYEDIKARAAVVNRWKQTKIKVLTFLETCRSLNQAAKVWPEIVNFLPEDRRKRLEEDNKPKVKKERTTPAPEEVLGQIDRDAIAGDLVALRFATA